MTAKLRLMRTAAVLVLIPSAAGLAVAQVDPPKTVPKGAVAQPAVVQEAPVATIGPMSRPGKSGALGVRDSISVALTENECKGLGGTVNDFKDCKSGKGCVTADKDGVQRAVCITK